MDLYNKYFLFQELGQSCLASETGVEDLICKIMIFNDGNAET